MQARSNTGTSFIIPTSRTTDRPRDHWHAGVTLQHVDGLIAVPSLAEPHFMEAHYIATLMGLLPKTNVIVRTIDTGFTFSSPPLPPLARRHTSARRRRPRLRPHTGLPTTRFQFLSQLYLMLLTQADFMIRHAGMHQRCINAPPTLQPLLCSHSLAGCDLVAVVAGDSVQSLDRFCVLFCWFHMRIVSFAFHLTALNSSSAQTPRAPPPISSCRRPSSPTDTTVWHAGTCTSCAPSLAFESSCLVNGSCWSYFQSFKYNNNNH